jgi:hypothetical protein
MVSSKDRDLIIAEIHHAINKVGGSAQPAIPDEAQRALRDLAADIDLLSIVDSWQDTLPAAFMPSATWATLSDPRPGVNDTDMI